MHLGVNIDHVATLRQARMTTYPDPVAIALMCIEAGAEGITAHLREDRRHIHDEDMHRLAELATNGILHLNMEMAATNEMVLIAKTLKPQACCLVPEKREELTTEGGLDVVSHISRLKSVVSTLAASNIRVSMFIDPSFEQIDASREIAAPVIELHTGHYANLHGEEKIKELAMIRRAADYARDMGLIVHAGHGLTLENTADIVAIDAIEGLNIGHAIVADSVFKGMDAAVRDFKKLMSRNSSLGV
ncbi:MAG: pyridoxine 5'-phosphate synthase [Zetaproteobacteria bacterium CG_4_9_14_3_um_filter_49_83]|nr:MAG: pyridoxine 5'-phosphate synthase [Zetaproteobacteria bacterium CG1_02_49_23]PIQ33531.1 MAG: pyridoxine 5'-phosphate synthase [Zetaproteobacteria bacterium CG17_big_fil_post_rev_8_21_14_2_50_50_13]PIV30213.1 MAG: pyridoxine 5'-phosphate synthase [Zetaproteobacteria bacterium CG02_land_8_20_14_3_00_50_9]PIY56359.1 MAG: pyridoxine 5'-phosphate synthase [Zetaproteobacteria bacterium CG_4_10_14_0_8_um_filter_49_80]PJA34756.1 MAG: pyridoxine 5'-phosphate synthase [Zetaproteobacteria bacterium